MNKEDWQSFVDQEIKFTDRIVKLQSELAQAKKIIEVLEKSNEFYLNDDSWVRDGIDFLIINDSDRIFKNNSQLLKGGKHAREAAAKVKAIREEK